MRSQRRPFTVETKRTRRYWVQPGPAATLPTDDLLNDPPTFGHFGTSGLENPAPEAGREEALALAAQVFGEPLGQPDLNVVTEPNGSLLLESLPASHRPRVLPDLLAIEREQSEATEAAKQRRVTRRPRAKMKGEAASAGRQQATLQFEAPDQSDQTAAEWGVELEPGAALRASVDPARTTAVRSLEVEFTPIHAPFTITEQRGQYSNSRKWVLPRSERWKERRLPRVCWDRSAR
jgi:hypothetical protein